MEQHLTEAIITPVTGGTGEPEKGTPHKEIPEMPDTGKPEVETPEVNEVPERDEPEVEKTDIEEAPDTQITEVPGTAPEELGIQHHS